MNTTPSPILVLASVIKTHYWYVAQLPKGEDTCFAPQYYKEIGGKGLNITCALKQFGLNPLPIIGLGDDHIADIAIKLLTQYDITTEFTHYFPNYSSGCSSRAIDRDGNSTVTVHLGANLLLNAQHVSSLLDKIDQPQLIYAQFESSITAIETAFKLTSKSCLKVLNPSPWQEPSEILKSNTHILIVNEQEFAATIHQQISFSHCLDINGIQDLPILFLTKLEQLFTEWTNLNIVVVTLGKNGAVVFEHNNSKKITLYYQAGHIVESIDSTGCGDAFAATFCASVIANDPIELALSKANWIGAWISTQQGVISNFDQLQNELNEVAHFNVAKKDIIF